MPSPIDLSGQRFGWLVAVRVKHNDERVRGWLCLCDCGRETQVTTGLLRYGHVKSCGCKYTGADSPSAELTVDRLMRVLSYDPDTGIFRWRKGKQYVKEGSVAGTIQPSGYLAISIDGVSHRAHFLAWLYMKGYYPERQIDHRDLDKGNNRFNNLREATHQQNAANRKAQSNNTSGYKGVAWSSSAQKWMARVAGQYLGVFDKPEDAARAYDAGAARLYGEYARGNFI